MTFFDYVLIGAGIACGIILVAIVVWVCVFGLGLYWLKRDAQKEKKGVLSMALERVQKMHINNRRIP